MNYIVDTHAIIWLLEDDMRLSRAASDVLDDKDSQFVVPTIVLAEIAFLYARQRITIGLPGVFAHITDAANCAVYPLDEVVVQHLPNKLNIHDAIIVATALTLRDELGEDIAIITKDAEITSSGLVKVIW